MLALLLLCCAVLCTNVLPSPVPSTWATGVQDSYGGDAGFAGSVQLAYLACEELPGSCVVSAAGKM